MNNELEIMPVGMGVLVQPYAENPYLNDKTGILLSPDGDFINPDSGLKDKLEEHIICGCLCSPPPGKGSGAQPLE